MFSCVALVVLVVVVVVIGTFVVAAIATHLALI